MFQPPAITIPQIKGTEQQERVAPSPILPTTMQGRRSRDELPLKRVVSSLRYVKSREQLIHDDQGGHCEALKRAQRRSKIVCTIGSQTNNYSTLQRMYEAGANSFLLNLAYTSIDQVQLLKDNRDRLEAEYGVPIPIICVLKGSIYRIGDMKQPEIFLKKGLQYRIIIKRNILGDEHICSVDDEELASKVQPQDKLFVDYGQVSFTVERIEKSDETLRYLQQKYNYPSDFERPRDKYSKARLISQVSSNSLSDGELLGVTPSGALTSSSSSRRGVTSNFGNILQSSETQTEGNGNFKSQKAPVEGFLSAETAVITNEHTHHKDSTTGEKEEDDAEECRKTQNPFEDKLRSQRRKSKTKTFDVIVCTVDGDCMLKGFKPIFIYKKTLFDSKHAQRSDVDDHYSEKEGDNIREDKDENQDDSDDFGEDILTPKDMQDIYNCKKIGVDSLCISNVRRAEEVKVFKNNLEKKNGMSIIAKIQTVEATDLSVFKEILREVDGIIIARGYLTVHIPVEKLLFKVRDMIHLCHQHMKPVMVSCNILESMISSLIPTIPEIGEISSLVNDYVDGIILSSETTYGDYPIESIQTLSRICLENERMQVKLLLEQPNLRKQVYFESQNPRHKILNIIVFSVMEAAYKMPASMIISFTNSGSSALKLSKLKPPCPIITICKNNSLARVLNYLSGVHGRYYASGKGQDIIIQRVIEKCKEQGMLKSGDFIIVTYTANESDFSHTDTMKIEQVQ